MAINKDAQRARWKRNKQAERERKSSFPQPLAQSYIDQIMFERDRRAEAFDGTPNVIRPNHFYFESGTYERALRFLANVWAADLILEAEWGPGGAKPRRVAKWFKQHGICHGYSDLSFPKMLSTARSRIKELEEPYVLNSGKPIWPPIEQNSSRRQR